MMVAVRPAARPILVLALLGAVLVLLALFLLGPGGIAPTIIDRPGQAVPAVTTTAGPVNAGPEVVSQGSQTHQPVVSSTPAPPRVVAGGPEDAGPDVAPPQPAGYSSTACGPHPCKP